MTNKKLTITNVIYFRCLLVMIAILLGYNLCAIIVTGVSLGLIALAIQTIFVVLLVTEHYLSLRLIKIWATIVPLGSQALKIVGSALESIASTDDTFFENFFTTELLYSLFFMALGAVTWILADDCGKVIVEEVDNY